tara:strand:- start:120 stop:578 length:459 start_codon:yes stop_codon:yes gene_type:complete
MIFTFILFVSQNKTKQNQSKTMESINTRLANVEEKFVVMDDFLKRLEALEEKLYNKKESSQESSNSEIKKVKKDVSKTKRVSGYILFQKANRDLAIQELSKDLEGDAKIKQSEVMKKLGAMWKELEQSERDEYNSTALEMKSKESSEESESN